MCVCEAFDITTIYVIISLFQICQNICWPDILATQYFAKISVGQIFWQHNIFNIIVVRFVCQNIWSPDILATQYYHYKFNTYLLYIAHHLLIYNGDYSLMISCLIHLFIPNLPKYLLARYFGNSIFSLY